MVAAIFDLDGTLLDTESVYLQVEGDLVRSYGAGDIREVTPQLLGTSEGRSAEIVISYFGLDLTVEEYLKVRREKLLEVVHTAGLLPGAEKLVKHLSDSGIEIAIATSSPAPLLKAKRSAHGIFFGYFPVIVCADDVEHTKPAPDIFLLAAQKLGVKPEDCIVFEDAPAGVKAAVAAGMKCVGLRNEHTDATLYDGADLLINSLEEFDPAEYGFPPY